MIVPCHTYIHTPFSSLIQGKGSHVQSMLMSSESVTMPPWEDKAPSTPSVHTSPSLLVPKPCAENVFSSSQKSNTLVF